MSKLAIILALSLSLARPGPGELRPPAQLALPLPTPDWQILRERMTSCTQPFFPELTEILYNKPGTSETWGELIVYYDTTPDGTIGVPIIVLKFRDDDSEGLVAIYVVLPTGKVQRFTTLDEVTKIFPRPCDVYKARHAGVPA